MQCTHHIVELNAVRKAQVLELVISCGSGALTLTRVLHQMAVCTPAIAKFTRRRHHCSMHCLRDLLYVRSSAAKSLSRPTGTTGMLNHWQSQWSILADQRAVAGRLIAPLQPAAAGPATATQANNDRAGMTAGDGLARVTSAYSLAVRGWLLLRAQ